MSRRLANVTLDNLDDLPRPCRRCVRWEVDPVVRERAECNGDTELEKEAWVSSVLLDWGSCGKIVYVDGIAAGYVLYAPPVYVPGAIAFPTSPVSPDAVLLMTARIRPEFEGGGLGRMLVQGVAKDLSRRGVKALEAFGDAAPAGGGPRATATGAGRRGPERSRGSGSGSAVGAASAGPDETEPGPSRSFGRHGMAGCVVPADYLLAVGFKTVRPHPRFPRLRLEIKNALSWREDMEVALERLLGSMSPEPAFRPA